MSLTGEAAAAADSIVSAEVEVHKASETIEDKELEADEESDQVLFLLTKLTDTQRRRTLLKLQPLMEPLMSSTVIHHETSSSKVSASNITSTDGPTLVTSSGNITLSSGTSKVVIQSSSSFSSKLKLFSGDNPVPHGQVDYRTWQKAAERLCSNAELSETELIGRVQNSLVKPALELVQSALDSGSVRKVLDLLEKAYGSADDPRDLLNAFNATMMMQKEKASEYLNRLYLLLEELRQRHIVESRDAPSVLIKQFVYGCSDENLVLKLRLEERGGSTPDFGALLLAIRQEEAKRTRKQLASKLARSQQVHASEEVSEIEILRKEVASLRTQLTSVNQPVPAAVKLNKLDSPHAVSSYSSANRDDSRRRLRFCFKCGLDGHVVWKCQNKANPELVTRKFQTVKRSENR